MSLAEIFRVKFVEAITPVTSTVSRVNVDFVADSYGRMIYFSGDDTTRLVTKGSRSNATKVPFPKKVRVRQLVLSGWGPTKSMMPYLRDFALPDAANPSIQEIFAGNRKLQQQPHLLVVLGGLNDLMEWFREKNGKRSLKNATAVEAMKVGEYAYRLLQGVVRMRNQYSDPLPYVFWVGFGRPNAEEYGMAVFKWIDRVERFLSGAMGKSYWPEWLLFSPMVRGSMTAGDSSGRDNLHWSKCDSQNFASGLAGKFQFLLGEKVPIYEGNDLG